MHGKYAHLRFYTTMTRKEIEIMAPVGSWESLSAAIKAGADAVYFGIENLNMRSRSSNNFTETDLREIVRLCQQAAVKTYLTINIVLYDKDIPQMCNIVDVAKEAGVTAIIAADVAVMSYARSNGVEVHLSTQLNISNIESLKFYAQFADVVVLARELNMEQVAQIYKEIIAQRITGPKGELIQIEMFAHGALCMAVSGKCYLSLHEKNHSANRGACMQVCRRSYIVKEKDSDMEFEMDNEYIMSPKDLKTIHFLNKLIDAGVRVLKIEGRARGAEYVHTVVSCYREAIESIIDGLYNKEKISAWDNRLKRVFNRGFWDGYYLGQKLGEWSEKYGSEATVKKVYIGKCTNYFVKSGVAEFLLETYDIAQGDEYVITGPTTGAYEGKTTEIRVNFTPVPKAIKGDTISIAVTERIRRNDKLFKWVDATLVNDSQ